MVPKIIYVRPVGSPENTSNIGENPNINNLLRWHFRRSAGRGILGFFFASL